jgi:hypothetical protein
MNKNFNVLTNLYTLSKVKDILNEIKIENIPAFEKGDSNIKEYIITSIILELSSNPIKLNNMFSAITGQNEIDFSLLSFNEIYKVLDDFFSSTGDRLISWKLTQSIESNIQNDTDTMKILEMMMKNPQMMKDMGMNTENTSKN